MKNYLDLLKDIVDNGVNITDRTGTGRRKVFGRQLRFKMSDGFPLVTTRKIPFKSIVHELLWFIKGSSNVAELNAVGVHIWDQWAVKEEHIDKFMDHFIDQPDDIQKQTRDTLGKIVLNSIGDIYGEAWRNAPCRYFNSFFPKVKEEDIEQGKLNFYKEQYEKLLNQAKLENPDDDIATLIDEYGDEITFDQFLQVSHFQTIDQLQLVLVGLKKRPFSSRHIISTWIPEFIPFEELLPQDNVLMGKGALAPCHVLQQYIVLPPLVKGGKNRLSLMMTQRSCDVPLGGCFNIAQYSLLLLMVAQVLDMEADEFIWSIGDAHIYLDQIDLVKEQLTRDPLPLSRIKLNPHIKNLFEFVDSDIVLDGYQALPAISYPISI